MSLLSPVSVSQKAASVEDTGDAHKKKTPQPKHDAVALIPSS
jgi:hypothetical protein